MNKLFTAILLTLALISYRTVLAGDQPGGYNSRGDRLAASMMLLDSSR